MSGPRAEGELAGQVALVTGAAQGIGCCGAVLNVSGGRWRG
jgi:NAD(P)-dependent dehydrogenase (short-subunit alcohol dehydrogenase family)